MLNVTEETDIWLREGITWNCREGSGDRVNCPSWERKVENSKYKCVLARVLCGTPRGLLYIKRIN